MKDKSIPVLTHAYAGRDNGCRLNVTIPEDEYNLIKSVRLPKGTIEFTLSHLIKKLTHELRTRNITSCTDANRFEHFLLTSKLCLPGESCPNFGHDHAGDSPASVRGSSPILPDGQAHCSDDRGGVGQLHPTDGGSPEGHPDASSSPSSRGRGSNRTKGGKAKGAK